MQDKLAAWSHLTKVKTWLSTTKSKPHNKLSWSSQEDESSVAYSKETSGCPKKTTRCDHSNASSQRKRLQAHNKQRDDHVRVPRCLSRDCQVPRTRLPHPAWSKHTSQADSLLANSHTFKRPVPARNKQDATGRSTCSSTWSYTLD